jgi:tetratricopeptide (TPR) repeat protein
MAFHAFVVMPFGEKEGIDFNRVYAEFIKPALESADLEVFRADEEIRAGDIRSDMFQQLLIADLVVADLSIDNANVWYELGVRHALKSRGVIHIKCRRDHMPFDVYTDRSLRYRIKHGVPDLAFLEEDRRLLAKFASETMAAWHERKVSPVYHLLPFLKEPDWKALRVEDAKEFWEEYDAWADRIEIARKESRPGDVLVFAEEAPTMVLRNEAYRKAGKALLSLEQFRLALAQIEKCLALDPNDLESRRLKGLLLGRLSKPDAAHEWLEEVVKDFPDDAESWALFGRVEKESWIAAWRTDRKSAEEMRRDALAEEALLEEAISAYSMGFRKDPAHYYSGINAVTLLHLLAHLTGKQDKAKERDLVAGGVRWALETALSKNSKDYWARASLAEMELLTSERGVVEEAYKRAVAVADKDWFKLSSSRHQLLLLKDLGFRSNEIETSIGILDRALARLNPPEKHWMPQQVFLFSGHMVDAPDRKEPRFPADKEKIAADAIATKLDELKAGAEDLAFCGGACGGDLLFAEACLEREVRLDVRLPFDEPTFLQKSVAFAGDGWIERYFKVKSDPKTRVYVMPDELGPLPGGTNPYARNNLWQLYTALSWGPDKVRFICLWNRKGGDAMGGTEHMYETVQKYSGRVYVLDTTRLW